MVRRLGFELQALPVRRKHKGSDSDAAIHKSENTKTEVTDRMERNGSRSPHPLKRVRDDEEKKTGVTMTAFFI